MGNPPTLLTPGQDPNTRFKWGTVTQKLANVFNDFFEEDPTLNTYIGTEVEARESGEEFPQNNRKSLYDWAFRKSRLEAGRLAAYRDYDQMDDEFPEISTALDIISEYATQSDSADAGTFHIQCEDQPLADHIMELAKKLRLDKLCTPQAREIAKYGGHFLELIATDDTGQIVAVKPLDPATMTRNEDEYGRLQKEAFTQNVEGEKKATAHFQNWQIVHFRNQKKLANPYGNSYMESLRRTFKQICLMEDGMVMGRLYRSFLRYVFRIPVDGIPHTERDGYMKTIIKSLKKRFRFDQQTQQKQSYDNPMSANEDFYVPTTKEGASSDVSVVQGQGNLSQIGDVQYFKDKIYCGMSVPKELLAVEGASGSRATFTIKDMNFARKLRSLQQVLSDGLKEVLNRVMFLDGINTDNLPDWSVAFPVISTVDEKLQWETEFLKAQVADIYHDKLGILSADYIYRTYLDLSPEEIAKEKINQKNNPPQQRMANGIAAKEPGVPGQNPGLPRTPGTMPGEPNVEQQDLEIIRKVRTMMRVPLNDAPRMGEVHFAQRLRKMREEFGEAQIDREVFAKLFEQARNGHHAD